MEIQKIGANATAYIFDSIENYDTNVFLIAGKSKVFVVDTFCGSGSMEPILDRIHTEFADREVVVINTHFHWDHVWGNCSFSGKNIVSHVRCRALLDELWETQILRNGRYIAGRAEKQLPNITFDHKLMFQEEGLELFHSPGHTADSISVFDHNQGILYTGDNLEKPVVYVEDRDINTYIKTLKNYISYNPRVIVAGHTLHLTEKDIFHTMEYLSGLKAGKEMCFGTEYEREIHRQNLNFIHNT